jgi:hypothetical protein
MVFLPETAQMKLYTSGYIPESGAGAEMIYLHD